LRIHPDRQTLILAGEMSPRRNAAALNAGAQRVTVISARVDAVVTQHYSANGVADDPIADADFNDVSSPALPAKSGKASSAVTRPAYSADSAASVYTASAYASANRSTAFGGASAYARTQDLSERHPIIDTYA